MDVLILKSDENPISQSKPNNKYEILDELRSETNIKAQLLEFALYKDTIYTKEALEGVTLDIFEANKDKDVFLTMIVLRM